MKADMVDGLCVNLYCSSKPSGRTEDWLSYNEEEIVNLALMPQFPLEAFKIHRGVKRSSAWMRIFLPRDDTDSPQRAAEWKGRQKDIDFW